MHVAETWTKVGTAEFRHETGAATNQFADSDNATGLGLNFGYNWVPGDGDLLLGAMFDIDFINAEVQHLFPSGNQITSEVKTVTSAQFRIGFFPDDKVLLYGLAGASFADQELHISLGGPVTDLDQSRTGFIWGAGGELMLDNNLLGGGDNPASLFLEYQHTQWEKARLTTPDASPRFDYTWDRDSNGVKGGFRARF